MNVDNYAIQLVHIYNNLGISDYCHRLLAKNPKNTGFPLCLDTDSLHLALCALSWSEAVLQDLKKHEYVENYKLLLRITGKNGTLWKIPDDLSPLLRRNIYSCTEQNMPCCITAPTALISPDPASLDSKFWKTLPEYLKICRLLVHEHLSRPDTCGFEESYNRKLGFACLLNYNTAKNMLHSLILLASGEYNRGKIPVIIHRVRVISEIIRHNCTAEKNSIDSVYKDAFTPDSKNAFGMALKTYTKNVFSEACEEFRDHCVDYTDILGAGLFLLDGVRHSRNISAYPDDADWLESEVAAFKAQNKEDIIRGMNFFTETAKTLKERSVTTHAT